MRDFFYNKSDVLIATLIILIAAVVIYTRVGVIMDYPSKAAGGDGNSILPDVTMILEEGVEGILSATEADGDENVTDVVVTEPAVTEPAGDAQTEPPEEPAAPPAETPPASSEVTITISAGDYGTSIAEKLLTAGAITDKNAFLAEVAAQHADTKLKQGTFKIPAGATLAEIVKILVG
jgi:hypothetical protein